MIVQSLGCIGGYILGRVIEGESPTESQGEGAIRYLIVPLLLEVLLMTNHLGIGDEKAFGIGSVVGIATGGLHTYFNHQK